MDLRIESSWNERTCPAIPLSEEEVHNTINSWLSTGEIKLHHPRVPPTENEKFHPRFCRYHQFVGHPTMACQKLRRIFHERANKGIFDPSSPSGSTRRSTWHRNAGHAAVATLIVSDSSFTDVEDNLHKRVWSNEPKPPDAVWEANGNCEKAFWRKYTQPESFGSPLPKAQG